MSTRVEQLVEQYNAAVAKKTAGNIELELRFDDFKSETFFNLLSAAAEKYGAGVYTTTVHVSANDVVEGGTNYIQEFTYVNGERTTVTYMTKQRLERPTRVSDFMNYRIGLSLEKIIGKFETTTNSVARHRNRMTFEFDYAGNRWRLDMTMIVMIPFTQGVKVLTAVKNHTMTARDMKSAIMPDQTIYEVELELLRTDGALTSDALHVVQEIFAMLSPNYRRDVQYQAELYQLALTMNVNNPQAYKSPNMRLKQLAPQVLAINQSTFHEKIGSLDGMYLTLKYDGERAVVIAGGHKCVVLMAMNHIDLDVEEVHGIDNNVVVDAEIIFKDPTKFTIYVFDVIKINDERLTSGIQERIVHLDEACKIIGKYLPKDCKCIAKTYVHVKDVQKDVSTLWNARTKSTVPVDGLIFSSPDKGYRETVHYKWKPAGENTIDFVAKKCPIAMIGRPPYVARAGETCYILFVGIRHRLRQDFGLGLIEGYQTIFPDVNASYYPVQFSPSYDPLAYVWYHPQDDLDGKIVELLLKKEPKTGVCGWTFHRVRDDRKMGSSYYGNDFYTAETTYMNYINEFPISALWEPGDSYFQRTADSMYRASNGFKRHVITMHIEQYFKNITYMLDAAAGRGGDINRFRRAGVKNLLALDNDAAAINELVERGKYSTKTGGNPVYERYPNIDATKYMDRSASGMFITVSRVDLSSAADTLIQRCIRYGFHAGAVGGASCNFALHYFCTDRATITNFLTFIYKMLAPGAYFMYTVMNGADIVKIIGKNDEWRTVEGDQTKYRIIRNYRGDELQDFGQMIRIKLPFSDKLMSEPLCNTREVNAIATDIGFKRVLCKRFDAFLPDFENVNSATYKALTSDDREYVHMHCIAVLRK